jgi:hypothetical protein
MQVTDDTAESRPLLSQSSTCTGRLDLLVALCPLDGTRCKRLSLCGRLFQPLSRFTLTKHKRTDHSRSPLDITRVYAEKAKATQSRLLIQRCLEAIEANANSPRLLSNE